MMGLLTDARQTLREWKRSPWFTALAISTLGIGIGSTVAVFSLINGLVLRPLPFAHPERLVSIHENIQQSSNQDTDTVPAPDVQTISRDNVAFQDVGAFQPGTTMELSGIGTPLEVRAIRMTATAFSTLGVNPRLGRLFTEDEDRGAERVAVLSYGFWKDHFAGDPHILGTKIFLERRPYQIIGIMPQTFEFPLVSGHLNSTQIWIPMSFTPDELTRRAGVFEFGLIARLKPGFNLAQAQTDTNRLAETINRNHPESLQGLKITATLYSLADLTVAGARPLLKVLFSSVIVILLIACSNLASLLLVRAIRRRRESAVRLALGASTSVLLRQALVGSCSLSLMGALVGLVVAHIAIQTSLRVLPETLPRLNDVGIDRVVVLFAVVLAIITGLLCGIAPALAMLRTRVNESLKEGGRSGSSGGSHTRLRSVLVAAELAIALVLLNTSGFLLKSFERMKEVNPGFTSERVVIANYSLPLQQYPTQASVNTFNKELVRRLREIPGARESGLTMQLPTQSATTMASFVPDLGDSTRINPRGVAVYSLTQGNYFDAMGIKLLKGRTFSDADIASNALVAIVSKQLAQAYWPGQDPIGKRMRRGVPEMTGTIWATIVGEVEDVKQGSTDAASEQQFYQPVDQQTASYGSRGRPTDVVGNRMYLVLATKVPPAQLLDAVRSTVRSIDPQLALTQLQTMEDVLAESQQSRRFNTVVIAIFAGVAVFLAMLGVYGVIAFTVDMRRQELSIRMALGAKRSSLVKLIVGSGLRLAGIGILAGTCGAYIVTHLMSSMLFGVDPGDLLIPSCAAIAILFLSVGASYLPARRASSIDPIEALRS